MPTFSPQMQPYGMSTPPGIQNTYQQMMGSMAPYLGGNGISGGPQGVGALGQMRNAMAGQMPQMGGPMGQMPQMGGPMGQMPQMRNAMGQMPQMGGPMGQMPQMGGPMGQGLTDWLRAQTPQQPQQQNPWAQHPAFQQRPPGGYQPGPGMAFQQPLTSPSMPMSPFGF